MLSHVEFERRLATEPMFGPTRAFYCVRSGREYSREYYQRLGVDNRQAPCLLHMGEWP